MRNKNIWIGIGLVAAIARRSYPPGRISHPARQGGGAYHRAHRHRGAYSRAYRHHSACRHG